MNLPTVCDTPWPFNKCEAFHKIVSVEPTLTCSFVDGMIISSTLQRQLSKPSQNWSETCINHVFSYKGLVKTIKIITKWQRCTQIRVLDLVIQGEDVLTYWRYPIPRLG